MQANETAAHNRELLTFTLGSEEYGIDILKVQEIRGYDAVTTIANSPEFIKGVINLRDIIAPNINMRSIQTERNELLKTDKVKIDKELVRIQEARQTIKGNLSKLEDNIKTDAKVFEAHTSYVGAQDTFLTLLKEGKAGRS